MMRNAILHDLWKIESELDKVELDESAGSRSENPMAELSENDIYVIESTESEESAIETPIIDEKIREE